VILNPLPLSPEPEYLTEAEISRTTEMLLGEIPLARAWDYWKSRVGFAGL
jgi:HCOMODA/2-hydroxy-3-carboxy-muconic semialdehyde decarboxylase